jgi:hypothetical protein
MGDDMKIREVVEGFEAFVLEPEDVENCFVACREYFNNSRTQARPGTVTANFIAEVAAKSRRF